MLVYVARCGVPAYIRTNPQGGSKRKVYEKMFFKIGVAASAERRLQQLQTGCPLKIDMMATIRMPSRMSALTLEASLHGRFSRKRTVGEWFGLSHVEAAALVFMAHRWPVGDPLAFIDAEIARYKAFSPEDHSSLLRLVVNRS